VVCGHRQMQIAIQTESGLKHAVMYPGSECLADTSGLECGEMCPQIFLCEKEVLWYILDIILS